MNSRNNMIKWASVLSTLCEPWMCWTEVSVSSFSSFLLSHLKEKSTRLSTAALASHQRKRKMWMSNVNLLNAGTSFIDARPGTMTGCGDEAGPLSSCKRAFSKAWLKEFWKLGTGTRSDPSLSPSLSAAGGASSLSVWYKTQYWLKEAFRELHGSIAIRTGFTGIA